MSTDKSKTGTDDKPKQRRGILEGERVPLRNKAGKRYYRGKVVLADGSKVRVTIPEPKCFSATAARDFVDHCQEVEDETHAIANARKAGEIARAVAAPGKGETVRQWFARFHAQCERNGERAVRDRRSRYRTWIDPVIGDLPMTGEGRVDREAIRRVVQKLDEQIAIRAAFYRGEVEHTRGAKPGTSAKNAANVWGELTGGFAAACTSKDDALRVRDADDNPTRNVPPPEKSGKREQAALYPNEIVALLSCADVPLYRRELYAVALYAGLRQGECRGLVADDVDFDHGVINIRRQRRKRSAVDARTKTSAGVRQVPIHAALEPLLRLLVRRAGVDLAKRRDVDPEAAPGPLVHVPPVEDCAERLRAHDLPKAGCDRAELYRDDDERQHFTFHGLRHTAITHWAVAGLPLPQLMAAAGHSDYDATQRYIDVGSVLRAQRFGDPHPPMPEGLLRSTERSTEAGAPPKRVPHKGKKPTLSEGWLDSHGAAFATPAGIEPALPA